MKQFHAFKVDTINQCLWRGDERVPLAPKAFDLLRYLVDHAHRLVTQDEILEALWADTYVNPEVVKKYILGIRKVLGDRPEKPEFIRTFPKRGYQFVAPVSDDRQPAIVRPATQFKPFIDRPTVRAQIEKCLEKASGGARQVAFVVGEAGVGKTTFADLFVQRVALRADVRIARGQCIDAFGEQEAYYPLLEAVDQLVRRSDDQQLVELLRKRAPTWLLQFPALVEGDQRDALQRETIGTTRERMVREICELFEAIAADRLLVVVLEDLHWADPGTLDVLSAFARRRDTARALIVATQRPSTGSVGAPSARLRQDLAVRSLCEQIALQPFELAEVSEYLALEFDRAAFTPDLSSAIHRHSGGNALFVSAVVRELVTNGAITRDRDAWRLTVPVDRIEPGVPPSLQEMLGAQFDQLLEQEQRVLKAASVIGERFAAWMVASDTAELEYIETVCETLAERRLFIRSAGIAELPNATVSPFYEFHHSLYRQAIYRRLSDVARSKLHRAAGERLATLSGPEALTLAPQLAMHFEEAHEHERAIQHLMATAANAARRFAVRDSLDVLEHARCLVPRVAPDRRTPLEIEILERIGDAHYALGAMTESARAYENELALAVQAGLIHAQVQAETCFARPLGLLNPDRAIAVLRNAAQVSVAVDNPVMHARVDLLAAGARLLYGGWDAGDVLICDEADRVVRGAEEATAAHFDRMIYAHVLALRGDAATALRAADTGIPQSNETTGVTVHLFALSAQVLALLQLGQYGAALRIIRDNIETARKNDTDSWLFSYREAWLRTLTMDFAGAQRVCADLIRRSVYPTGQANAIARLATGFEALDQLRADDARRCFEIVREPAATPNFFLHWYWRMHAHVGLIRAWLQSGDLANARREAPRLIEAALSTADPNLQTLAWETSAQVAIAERNLDDAAQSIKHALAALNRAETPMCAWRVYALASRLDQERGNLDTAAAHHARARTQIAALAESFEPDEPLRLTLLNAPDVRRVTQAETVS